MTERVQEPYTEREPCGTERVPGYGNQPDQTRTRYCTRTKTRWVNRTRRKRRGSCETSLRFEPRQDVTYLVKYSFYANDRCDAKCFVQTPKPDGTFALSPCPLR